MLPIGKWVFFALSTSSTLQKQTGFRYTLPSASTQTTALATITGPFYDVLIDSTIFIGDDSYYDPANAWLQYVRLYLNYYPSSLDEMINLAISDTGSTHHALDISLTSPML